MSDEPSRAIDVPTSGVSEGTGMLAELTATFDGDPDDGCVWLVPTREMDGTDEEGRIMVIWPKGFTARTRPMRLYRANGDLAATEGDVVELGGGGVPFQATAPGGRSDSQELLIQCGATDTVWITSSIESVAAD
jgi:hypothetical protein